MIRGVLLCDGSSDRPLAGVLERVCADRGFDLSVTAPDLRQLPSPPGHGLTDRVECVLELGTFDVLFVHRDAEGQDPGLRKTEVEQALHGYGFKSVAVVPVRMTEAWLLLDEAGIRQVAGRPSGGEDLGLPRQPRDVESIADPKGMLKRALLVAGQPQGHRRRKRFKDRFGEQRRQLLERLDSHGRINEVPAWKELLAAIDSDLAD